MLPEISRRCRSCGAAVRAGARFCPQCGALMGEEPAATTPAAPETREVETPAETPAEAAPEREVAQTRDWTPPTKEFAAFVQSFDGAGARQGELESPADSAAGPRPERAAAPPAEASGEASNEPAGAPPPRVVVVETPPAEATQAGAGEEVEAGLDGDDGSRAAAPDARGRVARVREGTRARVERMRDEAIVVLEETPDDSGLRFVVAAAALFVVFVVLLFLSTTVLR